MLPVPLFAGRVVQSGNYLIDNSAVFDSGDVNYLSRTPTASGSQQKFTLSLNVKRTKLSTNQTIFYSDDNNGSGNLIWVLFSPDDTIGLWFSGSGLTLSTLAVFRDASSFYAINIKVDTTQAVASDRCIIEVNGETASLSGTYPTQNSSLEINTSAYTSRIGRWYSTSNEGDYILSDVHFIDGQALGADSFGEFDANGNWQPKAYSGSYGTNGVHLDFSDATHFGKDVSGNGNDFTDSGFTADHQVIDTPTNNFCTLNVLEDIHPTINDETLSEGNLAVSATSTVYSSTTAINNGKWYAECLVGTVTGTYTIDVSRRPRDFYVAYYSDGTYTGGTGWATYTTGDVIGVAYDAESSLVYFYKNNVLQGSIPLAPQDCTISGYLGGGDSARWNFGQDSSFGGNKTAQGNSDANGIGEFYYTPPSGFNALCTANLPEPEIANPKQYFNVATYTGDGAAGHNITGFEFSPDLAWIKHRGATYDHRISDSVRGLPSTLFTNLTNAEYGGGGEITAFNVDGLTVGASAGVNESGSEYVAWCWNEGAIPGFDIVSYTGDGTTSSGRLLNHTLGVVPEFVITKKRSGGTDYGWSCWHKDLGGNYGIWLNTTNAKNGSMWAGYSNFTASVFTPPDTAYGNESGADYINYLFASVEGFSKIGSYTGNGSTDGPFVYCGFRPAFVMLKRADAASEWGVYDAHRPGSNPCRAQLRANGADAENTGSQVDVDLLSNGFKVRTSDAAQNASSGDYIFIAFAEAPFKYARAQ